MTEIAEAEVIEGDLHIAYESRQSLAEVVQLVRRLFGVPNEEAVFDGGKTILYQFTDCQVSVHAGPDGGSWLCMVGDALVPRLEELHLALLDPAEQKCALMFIERVRELTSQ